MRKKVKKVIVLIAGFIFLILGLLGLVLPILQGVLFIIVGLILISIYFPEVREKLKKHTESRPHLHPIINRIEAWIVNFIGDINEV
jgi:uncharacterized membrane protein YbaN (DUF454 family)